MWGAGWSVLVQYVVQDDTIRFVENFDTSVDAVPTESQTVFARQLVRLHGNRVVDNRHASGDVQACLDDTEVAKRDARAGIRTDEATTPDGDLLLTTA